MNSFASLPQSLAQSHVAQNDGAAPVRRYRNVAGFVKVIEKCSFVKVFVRKGVRS